MDIKIHIFSNSNNIGNTLLFVYKTGTNEGYACASLDWSPYKPECYRLINFVNKVPEKIVSTPVDVPWSEIEDIIKTTVKNQSDIDVDKITYVWKNKVDKFLEISPIKIK